MLKINLVPFPQINSARLRMRKLDLSDVDGIYALRSSDEVNRFLDRDKAESLDDARNFIAKIHENEAKNDVVYWAIAIDDTNEFIGTICLWNIDFVNSQAEIGYEMSPAFQGKGYMKEAIAAVLNYGFSQLHLKSIVAYTHRENESSMAVLERNGFQRDLRMEMYARDLPIYMVIMSIAQ